MSARPRKRGRRGGRRSAAAGAGPAAFDQARRPRRQDRRRTQGDGDRTRPRHQALKKKDEIIDAVLEAKVKSEGFIEISGILDVLPEGYGFVRTGGYLPGDHDVYVSMSVVRRNELRRGDMIRGQVRPPKETEKYPALQRLDAVNGRRPEAPRGPQEVRGPHADLPGRAPAHGARQGVHDGAHHRPGRADRQGPAWPDRLAAEGRQDHRPQGHRRRHLGEQPRGLPHVPARRRAA